MTTTPACGGGATVCGRRRNRRGVPFVPRSALPTTATGRHERTITHVAGPARGGDGDHAAAPVQAPRRPGVEGHVLRSACRTWNMHRIERVFAPDFHMTSNAWFR